MYLVVSIRYLQFVWKIEIERSKFGAVPLKSCIPNTSGIPTGHVRYWSPVPNYIELCFKSLVAGIWLPKLI